ncbi:hypothetical protein MPSEU_000834300 [Mayamaea pseudoterrestris]|nr:hypothetical protein MPSEU_000834300 [Mayamaea pseudoterrestris]
MPPTSAPQTKPKKKKGRAPAHQNAVAFHHNPKSKKTAHILSLPIQHVCLKCKEKLEWRKQYRKYKPLTQPTKCNICEKRNVIAAYHTICRDCSCHSAKAVSLLGEWNENRGEQQEEEDHLETSDSAEDGEQDVAVAAVVGDDDGAAATTEHTVDAQTPDAHPAPYVKRIKQPFTRVCAICVKEPALRDHDDENDEDAGVNLKRLKLRELKTLERKQERANQKPRRKKQASENDDEVEGCDDEEEEDQFDTDEDGSDDEEDPFLLAVGGADKLAVGDAYQKLVLERQQAQAEA